MNQKITLQSGIKYLLTALAVFVFALIFPLGVIQNSEVSKSDEVILRESDPISVEYNGTQMFIAEGNYLKSVDLYIANDMSGELITFRVYDGAYKQLWETFYTVEAEAEFPGFVHIPVDMEMQEGWEYYYTVEGLTTDLVMYYEDTYGSSSFANGTYLYGGEEMPGINLIVRYRYTEAFSWWMMLIFAAVIGAVCYAAQKVTDAVFLTKSADKNKEITIQKLLQAVGNPLLAILTLTALLAVFPGKVFGVGKVNYGFYYLGILMTAAALFFGLNYKREGQEHFSLKAVLEEKLAGWLMAVCFAGVLWSCYEYLNGLYTIHHQYAACKLIVWLGLALICTFPKKNVWNLWSVLYLIAASVGGYFYAKPYAGIEEQGELYKLQVYVFIVGGYVLLQLIVSVFQLLLKKRRLTAKWNLPYALCLGVWAVLMLIFQNGRPWIPMMMVLFGAFYYCMWLWEKRDTLLHVFNNGIIFHFIYTIIYCLMHRPYLRFRFNRYGMVYHTVTMTGYYLALVLCAVMVRLLVQYHKTGRLRECWKELGLLGIGNVYLILTLSRTGYLAAFVMEIFIVIFASVLWGRKKLKTMAAGFLLIAAVTLTAFPAVFTMQRILPAVFNEPVYSEIEVWDYIVEKNEPKDSELYIDIQAFLKVAGNKLFGLDMGNISLSSAKDAIIEDWREWKNYQKPIYPLHTEYKLAGEEESYEGQDISNGRFEIFAEYIGYWNLTGHEDMGVPLADGSISTHAHNTFLQMIHDQGLITGVVFLLFGVLTFVWAMLRYIKAGEQQSYLLLTVAVMIAFAAAGMVEWIFHPCNPFGFAVMTVIIPLLFGKKKQ